MPSLLQPRLSCFYCGMRSTYPKDGRTRQFTCSNCTATNHLDSKGEITDPPSTPSAKQNTSFARPPPRPTSPIQPESDKLFCKTCLKNQQILTTLLAEYLPSEDDPQYNKYEAEYPAYRKNLERRYPQVCPQCAPRVQQHLNKTAYAAKADFLTRNIQRSKSQQFSNLSTSTSLLVSALDFAAMAWWASPLFQVLWHVLAFMGIPAETDEVTGLTPLMVVGCSVTGFRSRFLPSGCAHLFVDVVRKSLLLSLMLIWWNPTIRDRLKFPHRTQHASGLAGFYRFQISILAVRAAAWWYLRGPWIDSSASDLIKGVHGCAILFIVFSSFASLRVINYNTAPKISFKPKTEPLVEPDSFHYPSQNFTSQASPNLPTMSPSRQPFPVSNLGTRSTPQAAAPMLSRFAPPTPPPDSVQDVDDSMDWEPIRSSPIRPSHTSNPTPAPAIPAFLRPAPSMLTGEKSPFTGRLPPAPMSPAHRLRNPPPPPQFKPTPLSQQRDFFAKMGIKPVTVPTLNKRSSRNIEEDEDTQSQTYVSSYDKNRMKDNFELKPAQWTLQSDMDAAKQGTGLEDMFTTSFRIADERDPSSPIRNRRTARGVPSATRDAGDGREMFGVRGQEETAVEIVRRNLKDAAIPVGLAALTLVAAVLRDPGVRESMFGLWGGDAVVR